MTRYGSIQLLGRLLLPQRASDAFVLLKSAPRLVDVPGHGRLLVDHCLDFTMQTCLRTNLGTKRALEAMAVGQIIEIVSDNLSAVETIPFMLDGQGCEHLGTAHFDGMWKVYARRHRE